jgi:hypothetical protein
METVIGSIALKAVAEALSTSVAVNAVDPIVSCIFISSLLSSGCPGCGVSESDGVLSGLFLSGL